MNKSLLVNIKREDFGFVVARVLAVVAWVLAAQNLVSVGEYVLLTLRVPDRSYFLNMLEARSPTIVFVIALGYGGYRLWSQGHRFGGSQSRPSGKDEMVLASQTLMLSGLAMGSAIYLVTHGARLVVQWLIWFVESNKNQTAQPLTTGGFVGAIFDLLVGAAVFGWAYSMAGRVRVPEFEYEPPGSLSRVRLHSGREPIGACEFVSNPPIKSETAGRYRRLRIRPLIYVAAGTAHYISE